MTEMVRVDSGTCNLWVYEIHYKRKPEWNKTIRRLVAAPDADLAVEALKEKDQVARVTSVGQSKEQCLSAVVEGRD